MGAEILSFVSIRFILLPISAGNTVHYIIDPSLTVDAQMIVQPQDHQITAATQLTYRIHIH